MFSYEYNSFSWLTFILSLSKLKMKDLIYKLFIENIRLFQRTFYLLKRAGSNMCVNINDYDA